MTKKANFIFFLFLLLTVFACDKVDDLLTFRIGHQTTFTVESTVPLNLPLDIATPDITTNSNQDFENNDTRSDLVKDIKLEHIDLTVTNPSGKNFNFLKSVAIYISTDGSNEILLAYNDAVPTGVTTVELTPTKEKLDQYVKASSYKLRTAIVLRETLTQDVQIKVDIEFKVTAKPL
jgi:hypothetical protein